MDYSAALCAATGETVAQAVTIPLQLGSIPNAMRTLLERFGESFRPGDVFLVNDPFDGASHTPDIFVAKPSFAGETLIGFAVTVAHHGDVGGRVPGSCACDSTEVFQEGLRLPWLRLYAAGERNEALFDVLRANVRVPHELLGDLAAQVAACNIGDRALQELAARHGSERFASLMNGLLDHTEQLLRREIASWPDGTVSFTDYMDSDGIDVCDVELTVDLTIRGDELIADFSRSAPMVRGALNCTPSFAEASAYHTVMAASAIEIPRTGGARRPITVITKPGTVVHVLLPGASSMRGIAGYRLSDVMNGALAQLVPDRVPAAGEGGSTLAFFTGTRPKRGASRRGRGSTASSSSAPGAGDPSPTATTASRTRARAWPTSRSRWPRPSGRSWSSATASCPTRADAGSLSRRTGSRARVARRRARHDRPRPLRPPGAPAVRPGRWQRGRRPPRR